MLRKSANVDFAVGRSTIGRKQATHSPKGNLAVNTATTLASTETEIRDKPHHWARAVE